MYEVSKVSELVSCVDIIEHDGAHLLHVRARGRIALTPSSMIAHICYMRVNQGLRRYEKEVSEQTFAQQGVKTRGPPLRVLTSTPSCASGSNFSDVR
jgi:hypothetical protein